MSSPAPGPESSGPSAGLTRLRKPAGMGRVSPGTLLALVGGVGLAVYAAVLDHRASLQEARLDLRRELEPIRGALSRELFGAFQLMEGIAGLVQIEGGVSEAKFRALAAALLERNDLIRNVALAPDNVIQWVHPQEGNEAAVGLNYASHPEQWPGVRRAMEERRLIVAGPLTLVQGGRAVIGRRPIFIAPRPGEPGPDRYWGVVSTVVELDRLLARAPLAAAAQSLELALRGRDGQAEAGPPFFGMAQVFAGDPVVVEVPLPTGSWQLAARPRGGWPRLRPWTSAYFWGGTLLSVLLAGLIERAQRIAAVARQSETRFRTLAEESLAGVYLFQDGRFRYVNAATARILGRSREELLALPAVLELVAEEDRARVAENLRRRLNGEVPTLAYDFAVVRPDGQRRFVEVLGTRILWEGRPAVLGTALDVTERLAAQQRIARLNRTYAVLCEINQLIVRTRDPQEILAGACRVALEQGGFRLAWVGLADAAHGSLRVAAQAGAAPETLTLLETMCREPGTGCVFTARALAEGRPAVCNDVAEDPEAAPWRALALERGYRAMVSLPLRMSDRTIGVFNLYAAEAGFFDAEEMKLLGELAADLGYALENCEHEARRREAEEALRASRELFRELAETIQEVFWIRDLVGNRLLYASPAYERIWGRPVQDLLADPESWLTAVHPEDRERVREARQRQGAGDYDEEYRIVRPDGAVRWIRDRAYPVRNAAGEVVRIVGVARDITEQRQLTEQLRQSQKMEAIGLLAGGVAHDFNNILAVILLQTEMSAAYPDLPPRVREGLGQIQAAAERAARLTRQLLLFSRRQVMQPRTLDLNEAVRAMSRLLHRVIGEDIELELRLHPRPLVLRADPGMLDQVLMNLAVNARDAMPRGGRLTLETGEQSVDAAQARLHPDALPGRYVWLRVTDTGSGIAPEHLPHIFEPFFTTKAPGKGSGLGLATVFGIVQQHRGWIDVRSEPGRGASFQVFLPSEEIAVAKAEPAPTSPPLPGGSETLLLVEDEPAVRRLAEVVLRQAGYHVLSAEDGRAALAFWEKQRETIALLVTDLVMPGGWSGRDLAQRLRADKPALRVMFISGYSAEAAGEEWTPAPGEVFLPKPFTIEALLHSVRQCLDA